MHLTAIDSFVLAKISVLVHAKMQEAVKTIRGKEALLMKPHFMSRNSQKHAYLLTSLFSRLPPKDTWLFFNVKR